MLQVQESAMAGINGKVCNQKMIKKKKKKLGCGKESAFPLFQTIYKYPM